MNKAFTKESADADDEEPQLPALPAGGKNYITPAGYARIKNELLDLIDNERPKVVEIVHWAASNGDRSENGDYLYGKKRLREIDRRIRFLTKRLEIAVVSDPAVHHGSEQIFLVRRWSTWTNRMCRAPSPSWVLTRPTARWRR